MNIFITGGAGFLGLHLAKYFSQKKHKLTLLDVIDFEKKEYPSDCHFVKGDIRDEKLVKKVMKGQDIVLHAAAALPLEKKEKIYDVNINGTKILLDAALNENPPASGKRFIYISSTAVYGIPKKHPIFEDDPLVGVGPYGETKIASEKLCEEYRKKGMIITIIRPKTFVGTHRLGVFEILFDWIKDGKKIPVLGSGNNQYQLLDVDDLVESIYLSAMSRNSKAVNDTFNVGAKKYGTVREFMQEVFDYAKSGSTLFPVPALPVKIALMVFEKLNLSPLYRWVYETVDKDSFVSIEKIEKALDWEPRYSNAQALKKAYQWYLDHYDEVKSRKTGTTHTVGWKQGILSVFKRFL